MKNHRKLKTFKDIVLLIVISFLMINFIPPKKVMEFNPFISQDGIPMLCAHRGGSISNPENTLKAYKAAINEYDTDILETDLWMTKDGHLVLNHDETINRTSDVELIMGDTKEYKISDFTLKELKNFNFGYNFQTKDGVFPYRDLVRIDDIKREEIISNNDLSILEIEDLFKCFYKEKKDLLFIVEIKNPGEAGFEAARILDNLLSNKYKDYQNRVVVGTFHDEIERCLKEKHPNILRGASTGVATKFIISQLLRVNLFDTDSFVCLQIPTSQMGIDLTWDTYIKRAHRRNIAVQYWTINDETTMKKLIKKHCDAIMTDNPELLREVLNKTK